MAKVTFEFDTFEDRDELHMYYNAGKMHSKISEVNEFIRTRVKRQSPSEEEEASLEKIREILFIEEF